MLEWVINFYSFQFWVDSQIVHLLNLYCRLNKDKLVLPIDEFGFGKVKDLEQAILSTNQFLLIEVTEIRVFLYKYSSCFLKYLWPITPRRQPQAGFSRFYVCFLFACLLDPINFPYQLPRLAALPACYGAIIFSEVSQQWFFPNCFWLWQNISHLIIL